MECCRDFQDYKFDVSKKQTFVILGAGPTGLGAVQRFYEMGVMNSESKIIVLEQQSKPGGLASSERDQRGFLWDMGGHVVFSHFSYFDKALDDALPEWNRHVRASFAFMLGADGKRRFIPYPVQGNIHLMDKVHREESLKGLEQVKTTDKKPVNFDQWLLLNFGEGLCNIFMRKYNRKVWTVDPHEMNSVWVGERVAVPDIKKIKAKIAALENGTGILKDSAWGPNNFFRFPRYGGTGGLWENVTKRLPQGWFHFNQKAHSIDLKRRVIEVIPSLNPKEKYILKYDKLLTTVPLNIFLRMINDSDSTSQEMKKLADRFVFSHTHVIGIGLRGRPPKSLADKSWMYFPDPDAPFYRITVFSSYSDDHVPDPNNSWSLMCEVAEPKTASNPAYWTEDNLIEETVKALINYEFITLEQVISRYHHRLEHGYPVPFLERKDLLSAIQPWLQSNEIYSRGRFGGWRYEVGNQDHSFMQGVETADFFLAGLPEDTYPCPSKVNSRKNTNRLLKLSNYNLPLKDLDYEVVVPHYNENLDWLLPYSRHCHIYHKGGRLKPNLDFGQWEALANVGHISHVYLHHIISNYDRLANVTIFMPAGANEKASFCSCDILEYKNWALKAGIGYMTSRPFKINQEISSQMLVAYSGVAVHPSQDKTLEQFSRAIFGAEVEPLPQTIQWIPFSCFSVIKEKIKKIPVNFYRRIINYLEDHPYPEESHFMQILWMYIFN